MINTTIQNYKILEKIGQGGMGIVYKAYDTTLQRTVALKFLPKDFASNDANKARFLREARAASAINHPNVCTIFDLKEHECEPFIVMEYIEGQTLKDLVKSELQLPVEQVVEYAKQIAHGLDAAHEKGIIHRDIKSENIMLTSSGGIKVMDFGLARIKGASELTQSASTVGTVAYMSPEQLDGRNVDTRTDIFSYGVVLYELLVGKLPFKGEHPSTMIHSILHDEPEPVEKYRDDVPENIRAMLWRCLQKDANRRLETMRDVFLLFSTDSVVQKPSTTLKAGKRKRKKPWLPVLIGIVIAFISGLLFFLLQNANSTYKVSNRVERRLSFFGDASVPAWSPDGRYIAYRTNSGMYISPFDGGASRELENPFNLAVTWSWTPDSRAVLITGLREEMGCIAKLGINGEAPQIVADSALYASLSSDGSKMLYASQEKTFDGCVIELDFNSGKKRVIAKPFGEGTSTYKGFYSPNGKRISYIRWNGHGHELWVMNRDGSNEHRIETDPIQIGGRYSWAPDSKSFIVTGKLGHAWHVWNVALKGKKHARLTFGSENGRHVSASPDGKSFVFQKDRDESRICIFDIDSKKKSYPMDLDIGTRHPAFSLKGDELYFQTIVNGRWQIWRRKLNPQAVHHSVIEADMESCYFPVMTGDGKVLYVRSAVSQQVRHGKMDWSQSIWISSVDGGRQQKIVRAGNRVERMAPTPLQQNYLLYSMATPDGKESVCVLPPEPESAPIVIFTDSEKGKCSSFDWGERDKVLIAHSDSSTIGYQRAISEFDMRTREKRIVCHLDSIQVDEAVGVPSYIRAFAVSPNKRAIALIVVGQKNRLIYYNISQNVAEEVAEFDGKASPAYLVWSHDSKSLAIEMSRTTSDIYVSEPMKYAAAK